MNNKIKRGNLLLVTMLIFLFISPKIAFTQEVEVAPLKIIDEDNTRYVSGNSKPVAEWEIPIDEALLRELGLWQDKPQPTADTPTIQVTNLVGSESLILQGSLFFRNTINQNQISITIDTPTQNRYITVPNKSGEISVLGQTISGDELEDDSIDITTKVKGNLLTEVLSGNGIDVTSTVEKPFKAQLGFGNLTQDWIQSAPYDLILNNPESAIKLMDASGGHFAILDVDNLTDDITFSLHGDGGILLTNTNFSSLINLPDGLNNLSGLTDLALARNNLGLGTIATESVNDFLQTANGLSEIDPLLARTTIGLGDISTHDVSEFLSTARNFSDLIDLNAARSNLGLGTIATESTMSFLQVGNNLSEINSSLARSNLGLGSIAVLNSSDVLQSSNNLSELTDTLAARTSLGLGTMATKSVSDFLQVGNNLAELDKSAARNNLELGTIALLNSESFLMTSYDLADLNDKTSARNNLGLGSSATESVNAFFQTTNNLSEITDSAIARNNLSLGTIATYNDDAFFNTANNFSEITNSSIARSNLGLGTMATEASTNFLNITNNLSEILDSSAARSNLDLGSIATRNSIEFLQVTNNLSEISNTTSARSHLGLGSAATYALTDFLQTTNNLSDINATTARTNLGLGSIATQPMSNFLQTNNNLTDITNPGLGRTSLGLGSIATQSANNVSISGGTLNGTIIGQSIPALASFTSLTSSGNTTLGELNISPSGILSGVKGYTQSSGNFSILGSGTFSTGSGSATLNGDTTVSSGKTLSLTSSDSLRVGGNIIPQTVTVVVPMVATLSLGLNDQVIFVADNVYTLSGARCVYSAAASVGANLQVTVDTGTAAPGTGTDQLTATINLGNTINTVYTGTVIGSPTTINVNDKVSIDFSGTLVGILGSCTITLKRA